MQPKSQLTVIIVGGSISGLTLAHALDRANIDWVILDGHPIAPPIGASISIFQNGSMVLDQLGIYDDLRALVHPMRKNYIRLSNGKALVSSEAGKELEHLFGYSSCQLPRQRIIQLLYDHIGEKSKVHAGKEYRVVRVDHSNDGVEVVTENGTSFRGDVVVAADGIHSTVRSEMWRHAQTIDPGAVAKDATNKFVSDYSCLFGISEPVEGLPAGESNIIIGNTEASYLTFIGLGGEVYWLMYHKMASKYPWPDSPRFSKDEAEALANTRLKDKITETVTFEDLWKRRKTATLLPMEEGVLNTWHWGRFVTVGDSTHKMTVNLGQGGNCAIEGAAALANALNALITSCRGEKPTMIDIDNVLRSYQSSQQPRVKGIAKAAWDLTRVQAFEHPKTWLFLASAMTFADPIKQSGISMYLDTHTINYLPNPSRLPDSAALSSSSGVSGLTKTIWGFLCCLTAYILLIRA